MDYLKLSKEVSYALRHAPWEYELEIDEEGWVDINQLICSLKKFSIWDSISSEDLLLMIERSDKKRHEIFNGKIRALYGHSIPLKILKEAEAPPEVLYHGTARRFIEKIKYNGLLAKNRQYVHLSVDTETALQVGKRHDEKPVVLKIDCVKACSEGVKFYTGNDKVWLADYVPSKYIIFA